MATHVWRGDAPAVAQVTTVQVTAYDAATSYRLTINGKTVAVDGDTDVNDTATALAAAFNASTIPEFAEITASAATDTVTLTADTAGKPFTVTSSVSGGTGTIGAATSATANSGPAVVAAANFDSGSLPSNSDTMILQDSGNSLKYTLDALAAVTLDLLVIAADFSDGAQVGLPRTNTDSTSYVEYRDTYLEVGATAVRIGEGRGQGSSGLRLNLLSAQTSVQVFATGNSSDTDYAALQIIGTNASNVLQVFGGQVDVAMQPGQVATFATVTVSGGQVRFGSGVTLTTVEANGDSSVEVRSAATTLRSQGGGRIYKLGAGAVTTVDVGGGTFELAAAGTIGTLTVRAGKTFDASKLTTSVTITNATLYAGARVVDPNGKLVWSNAIACPDGIDSVTIISKKSATLLPG
jgi:hypothetical protein